MHFPVRLIRQVQGSQDCRATVFLETFRGNVNVVSLLVLPYAIESQQYTENCRTSEANDHSRKSRGITGCFSGEHDLRSYDVSGAVCDENLVKYNVKRMPSS